MPTVAWQVVENTFPILTGNKNTLTRIFKVQRNFGLDCFFFNYGRFCCLLILLS